jgi:hypothetical protein
MYPIVIMSESMMDLLIQPALVGVMATLKDILYEGYAPESPHLWVDVGIHMTAQLFATGVTMEFLVPAIGDAARIADPLIHGGLAGLVKENFIDTDSISALGSIERGRLPLPKDYTFQTGFFEGLGYGSIATGLGYAAGF